MPCTLVKHPFLGVSLESGGGGGGWRGGGGGIAPGQETSILLKPINFRFNFKVVT